MLNKTVKYQIEFLKLLHGRLISRLAVIIDLLLCPFMGKSLLLLFLIGRVLFIELPFRSLHFLRVLFGSTWVL